MSDLDDSDILEDIKLLEDVLAKDKSLEISNNYENDENTPKRRRISPENEEFHHAGKSPDELIGKAFEINEILITKYREAKEAVTARLQECLKKQEELNLKIKLIAKGSKGNCYVRYSKAGYPYFKDSKYFPAPLNDDAILKSKRAELMVAYQRLPNRWTIKDRNSLWMAVRLQAATQFFEKETKKQKNKSSAHNPNDQEPEIDLDKCKLPKNYKEMIGPLGSREFDWLKIAAQDFNNRHSADDCRIMWNIYIHPDINRYRFKSAEDKSLKRLVKNHNYEDWEAIARNLKTGRSAYQCFIRYATIAGPVLLKNKDVWSTQENKILMSVVDDLRIGNYIPWNLVTFYIDNRTKSQIYSHWKYNVDPAVRKGRFTVNEDELLLEGVTKFGKDFSRISKELIPHRTSTQLSGRFTLLMLKTDKSYNCWSVAEDMHLLKLFDEIGSQWSKIAEIMGKNRTYVRHRYISINRFLAKGGELSDMSRKVEEDMGPKDKTRIYDHAFLVNDYSKKPTPSEDIDTRLRKYFQMVQTPAVRPGRQPKYKSDAELARHTKQLYELCEKLDVRLDIPESLKIEGLTTRDKQLLASFRDYVAGLSVRNPEEIERTRIKMFGPDKPGNHSCYVPPPPFGLYFKPHGKRERKKLSEKTVDEDCTLVPDVEFETPENVEKMLSEEELEVFHKFSIFMSQEQPEPISFEQKFITEAKLFEDDDKFSSSDDMIMISWGRKISKVINKYNDREQTTFIEPCHSTLHGYDTLRYMKETNNHSEWTKKETEMSRKPVASAGKHAFHLFKTRFTRLFKYPIGMVRNAEAKSANSNLIILPRARCNQPDEDASNSLDIVDSDD